MPASGPYVGQSLYSGEPGLHTLCQTVASLSLIYIGAGNVFGISYLFHTISISVLFLDFDREWQFCGEKRDKSMNLTVKVLTVKVNICFC